MHFGLQAVGNNRVEFNLFDGVHDLFIRVLSISPLQWHDFLCNVHSSLSLFAFLSQLFLSISPPESCQYDIHSSEGEPGSFCAPRALWPSPGGQPQSICNHSSALSTPRPRSSSDEAHLLWLTWRTGNLNHYSAHSVMARWKMHLKKAS